MSIKIKTLMILSIIKWVLLKMIIPGYFVIQAIMYIGEPEFTTVLYKAIAFIILSLTVEHYLRLEVFLTAKEKKWIEDKIKEHNM